jgi:hypothetical protein
MYNLAYYTCYFGGPSNYARTIPPIPSQTVPCYYITNDTNIYGLLENTPWIPVFADTIPVHNCPIKDAMETKLLRTCPHRFEQLQTYDYLCWFDSKLQVYEEKVNELVSKLSQSPEKILVLSKHPYSDEFTSVWDEFNLAMQVDKYSKQKDQNTQYIKKQIENGFSEKITIHFCVGFIIRKMCVLAEECGECWYSHIQECGIEDQISFQFVQQKYIDSIIATNYQETWKYFYE